MPLREKAAEEDRPLAWLVRRALEQYLAVDVRRTA